MTGQAEFAEFVRDRYAALARSAFLLTGDRGHAEDLVQTALVKTHDAWHLGGDRRGRDRNREFAPRWANSRHELGRMPR